MVYTSSKQAKAVLAIFICLLFYLHLNAQNQPDTTLSTYIKVKRYTQVTDTVHIDKAALPYYYTIMDFMTGDNAYLKTFYIPAAGVKNEDYTLTIQLCNIKSIIVKKMYDKEKPRIGTEFIDGKPVIEVYLKTVGTN